MNIFAFPTLNSKDTMGTESCLNLNLNLNLPPLVLKDPSRTLFFLNMHSIIKQLNLALPPCVPDLFDCQTYRYRSRYRYSQKGWTGVIKN